MSFDDVMHIILPPIADLNCDIWSAVKTSDYGKRTRDGKEEMHLGSEAIAHTYKPKADGQSLYFLNIQIAGVYPATKTIRFETGKT